MTKPRLHVALPWLEDAARDARERGSLPDLPALAWMDARGTPGLMTQPTWRHWLLEAGGDAESDTVLQRWPAGPCLAALLPLDTQGVGTWACAQPAHLATAIDHLRLAPLQQTALTAGDRTDLAATINAQLADRGFELQAFVDGTWVLRCTDRIECLAHDPAVVTGHNIHDFMPAGRDGARVRSFMNEIQMMLHEHPVNAARARRHEPVINALWLWGFGAPVPGGRRADGMAEGIAADGAFPDVPLLADDPWLRGLWQVHGREATTWTPLISAPDVERDGCIAVTLPPVNDTATALSGIDGTLLEPLRIALAAGRIGGLDLLIGSRVIHVEASARYRFWRRAGTAARLFA